ncbi:putative snrnp sm protein [Blattamonas nauphoetae]|uniref:Snrnp sm protein n=1 Tax=Blattamonas nauphoetae TaxID=2049346 RepID=A0ABQ9XD10_9EUKA|nr:putative snrnp sm protein [Blattamonas nauphoetae]
MSEKHEIATSSIQKEPAYTEAIRQPLDTVRLALGERVYVKLRGERELRGKLHGFDQHMNILLSDAEETITHIKFDPVTNEEITSKTTKTSEMIFVRGDLVILVSIPRRAA